MSTNQENPGGSSSFDATATAAAAEPLDGGSDLPPGLREMFINSTDTLRRRQIDQTMPQEWSDRPPLFYIRVQQRKRFWRGPQEEHITEDEDPNLLKGMVRQGIPPPLRCAVWLSNIIQATYPHQDLKLSHEYRTLAKVQVLDYAYAILWEENGGALKRNDVSPISFGNTSIWEQVETYPGKDSLINVLFAVNHVFGSVIEYAPLVPTLAALFLGSMSESYVFCAIREMSHHSTWYWATSISEDRAYRHAFLDILGKLHPHTYDTMEEKGVGDQYAKAIFQDFFVSILPEAHVLRILDIYTLEGAKALFRFGVALAVLYHKVWKEKYMYEFETTWWDGLIKYGNATDAQNQPTFPFDLLLKKAYGVHGRGVRKRFRFPRRPILARIIQLEEERYWREKNEAKMESEHFDMSIPPLGLVPAKPTNDPDKEPIVPKLAESSVVRTKLAEWLPMSLRFTNLELIYSTNHHGRTLESLYRHCSKTRRTILLLEVLSSKEEMVVGMFAGQTWHPSPKVYGDGSCFLFRIVNDQSDGDTGCWKWHPKGLSNLLEHTDEDMDNSSSSSPTFGGDESFHSRNNATALLEQFQVSTADYMSMGGNSNGISGLRLNEDLTKGESSPAAGFENPPLAGDLFEVGLVEVYQMVREADGRAVL